MIRNSILIECSNDYVGLWSIAWEFRTACQNNTSEVREKTLRIVEELLNNGLIQPGIFTKDGNFELWESSPVDTIARIEAEWNALEREPDIGDIVWFVATEKGEREVGLSKQK